MKLKKRIISLLMVLLILALLVGGCVKEITDEEANANANDLGQDLEDDNEEETKLVDMAGREIILPENVDTVFSIDPVGSILLYTLDPDKMVAWNYSLKDGEKRYIDEKYHDLPNLGGAGRETVNSEELLKVNPDIIITMDKINDTVISQVEEMEEQLGRTIIIIDDDINKLDEAYILLGKALGEEEKAEELAKYCKDVFDDIGKNIAVITEEMKVNIYYAEGPDGLQTEPAGSWHGEVMDMVGGNNVVKSEEEGIKGKSEVSIEQVIAWDPDIIVSWDDERGGYYSGILEDPIWKDIQAVKDGEVYEIPNKPFNWLDRPPSVNRVLGLKWVGNLLYPDIYDYNMRDEVEEFYDKFYHYDLTEDEIDDLLKNTIRYK